MDIEGFVEGYSDDDGDGDDDKATDGVAMLVDRLW